MILRDIYPMEDRTITLIIALPLPSHQRSTISRRYPTILTECIFPCGAVRWHRWPEVATGREGGTPSCTPRGARWAEFNLEQPYVLWCSVHGQCSRHRTNARQRSALSWREPRWLRSNLQFTIVSSLEQVSELALTADRPATRFYENSAGSFASIILRL